MSCMYSRPYPVRGPSHVGIADSQPMTALATGCDSVSVGNRMGDVHCVRRVLSLFPVSLCGAGQVHHFRVTCMTRDCFNSRLSFFYSRTGSGRFRMRIGGGNDRIIYHSGIVFRWREVWGRLVANNMDPRGWGRGEG